MTKSSSERERNDDEISADNKEENCDYAASSGEQVTLTDLGVCEELCKAYLQLGYTNQTEIQIDSLSHSFERNDIIGLEQTGSGKTASIILPILHNLLHDESKAYNKLGNSYVVIISPSGSKSNRCTAT